MPDRAKGPLRGSDDAEVFESHRSALLALAYRMLGDLGRAEDMVQEGWIRWQRRQVVVERPKSFLATTVARLCLDEITSARARREESRSDRLPEPVDLGRAGLGSVELLDEISMGFLVLLQRLTTAERAVFLLHEVFDLGHDEIGALLGKSAGASRQLLKRARENVAKERRSFRPSLEEHRRLLAAFVDAVRTGDEAGLHELLTEDAVLVVDAGSGDARYGKLRRLGAPVFGRARVVAIIKAFRAQEPSSGLVYRDRILNGEPAVITLRDGAAMSALFVDAVQGKIRQVFLQNDPERLRHVGA